MTLGGHQGGAGEGGEDDASQGQGVGQDGGVDPDGQVKQGARAEARNERKSCFEENGQSHIYSTRGNWTAMPVLINEIRTGQIYNYFYVQKIVKTCLISGIHTVCVCKVSHF